MTNARYALAKLAGRVPELGATRGTDRASITPEDVAAACAGLARGPYLIALAKYAHDWSGIAELERIIWLEVVDIAIRPPDGRPWRIPVGQEILRNLGRAAALEAIEEPLCDECSGRRVIFLPGGLVEDCEACAGTGRGRYGAVTLAASVGVSLPDWAHVWGPRYAIISKIPYNWLYTAVLHINQRLNDDG